MSAQSINIVITKLEMTSKPAAAKTVLPRKYENGRAALFKAAMPPVHFYRYLYDTVGRAHKWVERKKLSDAELRAVIHDPLVEIYVLYADGAPAGYFELDGRNPPDLDLAYFGLIPEHIGQGLGSFLLATAIQTAWAKPIDRLRVHTNNLDHPRALPIYQKHGFVPYAQERTVLDLL